MECPNCKALKANGLSTCYDCVRRRAEQLEVELENAHADYHSANKRANALRDQLEALRKSAAVQTKWDKLQPFLDKMGASETKVLNLLGELCKNASQENVLRSHIFDYVCAAQNFAREEEKLSK